MKIIYEAFDGTQFDNFYECEDYEWKKKHENSINDIMFFNKNWDVIEDKLSEKTYDEVMHIIVNTNEGLQTLKDIVDYTGFCCYDVIDKVGEWGWNDEEKKFIFEF